MKASDISHVQSSVKTRTHTDITQPNETFQSRSQTFMCFNAINHVWSVLCWLRECYVRGIFIVLSALPFSGFNSYVNAYVPNVNLCAIFFYHKLRFEKP